MLRLLYMVWFLTALLGQQVTPPLEFRDVHRLETQHLHRRQRVTRAP